MLQNIITLSLLYAAVFVSADTTFYPNTTGPHRVGYKHLELVDYTRPDIFAQRPAPRDLMTTLYYPIADTQKTCAIEPLLGPHLAAYLDAILSTPSGTFKDFALPACANASMASPDLPLVLFSHGYRGSRLLYSGFLQELASYGYNVLAVDHPSDAQVVEYPDGRFVYNSLGDNAPYDIELALHVRVQDMIFALNAMNNRNITSRIPGLSYRRLQTSRVGILGHSLGGATTFQSTANDTRFVAGTSFDGPFWGSANQTGTDAPYMLMAALEPSNAYWEAEWTATWPLLRSAKGWFNVAGSMHLSFDDFPLLSELLGAGTGGILGNVTGTRMIEIQSTFTKSFFNQFLKNQTDGLFDGGISSEWPEVSLVMS